MNQEKTRPVESSYELLGQPTRRFTTDDLRDPRVVKYIRKRMGLTQRRMCDCLGMANVRKYQVWEHDGMIQHSELMRRYVLMKFDLFLLSEKHGLMA